MYREYGIFGALGLSDQARSEESDMVQAYSRGGGGGRTERGVRNDGRNGAHKLGKDSLAVTGDERRHETSNASSHLRDPIAGI